jgi:hypothetical protein
LENEGQVVHVLTIVRSDEGDMLMKSLLLVVLLVPASLLWAQSDPDPYAYDLTAGRQMAVGSGVGSVEAADLNVTGPVELSDVTSQICKKQGRGVRPCFLVALLLACCAVPLSAKP